jgi:hypothetical protein
MLVIEGKSVKIRAEIETVLNQMNLCENKRKAAESDIEKFKEELV